MKKIFLSIILLVLILVNSGLSVFAESTEININDIPLDWEGWYMGYGAHWAVKRSMEMHINAIATNGYITGTVTISPYIDANREDDADGSYTFKGNIDFKTGTITLRGDEWIDFPVGYEIFNFANFYGVIDTEKRTIIGGTKEYGWEMGEINYTEFDEDCDFILGRDNNSFIHNNDYETDGFYDIKNYNLSDEYFDELVKNDNLKDRILAKSIAKVTMQSSWNGSCYGISSTMGLLKQGMIEMSDLTDSDADSYFKLGNPREDPRLLNAIQFYQVCQYIPERIKLSTVASTYTLDNFSDIKTSNIFSMSMSLFLHKLVDTVKEDKIALFSFGHLSLKMKYGDVIYVEPQISGHTILAVGVRYDPIGEQYFVKLYDMNSVRSSNPIGEFSEMVINKNFTNFYYKDAIGTEISRDNGYLFMMLNKVELYHDISGLTPSGSSASSVSAEEAPDPSHALIDISLENDFTVTSGDKTLQCSEGKLSGSMEVYDIMPYIDGDKARFYIEVDNYPDFTVTPQSETIDIAVMQEDYYMSLEAENLDSAYCNIENGRLTMKGLDYNYKAFMGVDCTVGENEGGLISIEGSSSCDITVNDEGGCAVITSEGAPLTDAELKSYIGTDVFEMENVPKTQEYIFSANYKGHELLFGDANFDGKVTASDSLKVLRSSINLDKLDTVQKKLSDVNEDGVVNAKDSLLIQRYTIGMKNTGKTGDKED